MFLLRCDDINIGGLSLRGSESEKIEEILFNLVCRKNCKFYKAGVNEKDREKYQCGAYLGLKKMLMEGKITVDNIQKLLKKITGQERG